MAERYALAPSHVTQRSADELNRLRGPLATRDREVVDHWRRASPAAHARAMIELSRYAVRMARQTGLGKRSDEMFPGFPEQQATGVGAGEGGARARHRRTGSRRTYVGREGAAAQ